MDVSQTIHGKHYCGETLTSCVVDRGGTALARQSATAGSLYNTVLMEKIDIGELISGQNK